MSSYSPGGRVNRKPARVKEIILTTYETETLFAILIQNYRYTF